MTTHRKHGTKEYRVWQRIKTICYNKNNPAYKTYGARGIEIHPSWKTNFQQFYRDMGEAPDTATGIELIDLNKDFCKENCRWIDKATRRPLKEMPNQKNRERQKRYKKPKKITITVENDYFERLQRQAIEKSRELNEPISCSEFIKLILEEKFPIQKQMNLFKKQ